MTRTLEQDGTNHENCRGQSYDNQATIAGVHSGVKKRVLFLDVLEIFVYPPLTQFESDFHAAQGNDQSLA
jgi:hypothetical protein